MHVRNMDIREASKELLGLLEKMEAGDQVILMHGQERIGSIAAGGKPSLKDIRPASVGALLRPYPVSDDDLLAEMLDR